MLRRFGLAALLLLFSVAAKAQILNPIKWSSSVEQKNETEATLIFKPIIEKGWHIYGQVIEGDGPIPTEITFAKSNDYELLGKPKETGGHKMMDATWGFEVTYLSDGAFFSQKNKLGIIRHRFKSTQA